MQNCFLVITVAFFSKGEGLVKGRTAKARFWWEVCSTPERSCIRGQKHCEGPATLFTQMMQCSHVNGVYVRALFSVNFDVDKFFIHQPGRLFILEAFMCHHVAPVTGSITNRDQDWLVLFFCRF